ncbi:acyl carrier protein phosphodiesterase [Shewanella seohaensis]|uniref:acyl carrier protein phosphodiesterase n=1 Tax=Shewanella seohaensis TaxID=755175 RepID=UPI00200FAE24|nr:acyl carrier protein phosphodiesterase [Shewanella seohaensis]MCL1122753.1 acyl carrier protein phosphodiesterase [Shewanella seohaensis]UXM81313.1 acyl carrier protein phosphodiesterase [Shewanella seohaensis]
MNILTHLHLAEISKTHLGANLAGNFITAPIDSAPQALRQGLWLNQEINQLCATHELTQELMALFPAQLTSIAADLMFVSFDHYLAYYWEEYHHLPLPEFSQKAYRELAEFAAQNDEYHPQSCLDIIADMRSQDWLNTYATPKGIQQALAQRAKGHPHSDLFNGADKLLAKMQIDTETAFRTFYPQLMAYTRIWSRKTPSDYLPSGSAD